MMRKIVLFLLACILIKCHVCAVDEEERFQLIEEILPKVAKTASFFNETKNSLNLDGAFGIRLAADQLRAFLDTIHLKCREDEISSLKDFIDRYEDLQATVGKIADLSIPFINRNQPNYYKVSGFLLKNGLWNRYFPTQAINSSLEFPKTNSKVNLVESESDRCLKEWDADCRSSDQCWELMTPPNRTGYYITHELLFVVIGNLKGCEDTVEEMSQKHHGLSSSDLLKTWCSNIYLEADKMYQRGLNFLDEDLFMEQISVCGIVGYKDFYRPEWIKKILSWQQPSGCYTVFGSLFKIFSRVKREEKLMPGSCLAHKTTLGLVSLTEALRFLLEPSLASHCANWI